MFSECIPEVQQDRPMQWHQDNPMSNSDVTGRLVHSPEPGRGGQEQSKGEWRWGYRGKICVAPLFCFKIPPPGEGEAGHLAHMAA